LEKLSDMIAINRNSPVPPSEVESVFVFRPDNLGDVVLFSGSLRHIRAHYPNACITMCVKKYVSNYLELCPHIDRILQWEELQDSFLPPLFKSLGPLMLRAIRYPIPTVVLRMLAHLMKPPVKPQLALFPCRSSTWGHHVFASALASDYKVGIGGDHCNQSGAIDEAVEGLYTHRLWISPEKAWDHELVITRDFLNMLQIRVSVDDIWPEVWTAADDRDWALNSMPPRRASIVLGIAPGAGRASKIYPPGKLADAFAALSEHSFSYVIFGSKAERRLCRQLEERLSRAPNARDARDLSGRTTVRQLVECLKLCDIVVAADTAALHLATVLRKPTVGIMGGGHFGRFYPWGTPDLNRVANLAMDCYHCNWKCRYQRVPCVKDIPLSVICRELRTLIDATMARPYAQHGSAE
jgi:ADP-heptose:LPS heptosyltransferase